MPAKKPKIREFHSELYFKYNSDDLREIVHLETFVDKSSMIKRVFKKKMMLITAPHQSGKTTNMDMIKKFVEIQVDENGKRVSNERCRNRNTFEKYELVICSENKMFFDKYFAAFPVIHVDFKPVIGDSFEEILTELRKALHTTFKRYKYLLTTDKLEIEQKERFEKFYNAELHTRLSEDDIVTGLKFLSECLYQHFSTEVFVLIDEYDAPISQSMFFENVDLEQINKLMSEIYENLLEENKCVERAFLTGVSYFASVVLSGVNNIEKFMFLGDHEFAPYYGLTKVEIAELFMKFELTREKQSQIISHHDAYINMTKIRMYPITPILNFLRFRDIENYWGPSESILPCLESALYIPAIRTCIHALCLGWNIEIEIPDSIEFQHLVTLRDLCSRDKAKDITRPDIFLCHLLHQGCLSIVKHKHDNIYEVGMPNYEIVKKFEKILLNQFDDNIHALVQQCAACFNNLSPDLGDGIFENFLDKVRNLLNEIEKSGKLLHHHESTYHCIMFMILSEAKLRLLSEFSFKIVTTGNLELILVKQRAIVIIKLTFDESAEEALKQIKNSCYSKVFHIHRTLNSNVRYLCMGININEDNTVSMSICKKNVEGFCSRRTFPNQYVRFPNQYVNMH